MPSITKTPASTKTKSATLKTISPDLIRKKAEELFHQRILNGTEGDELTDWLTAEAFLLKKK